MEINGASAKLVKHWFPDAEHKGDIRPLAENHQGYAKDVWKEVRALEHQPAALILACGFPCRELSGVNQNRQGLHAGETARFHEALVIFQALVNERDDNDPPLRVVFENAQSMPDDARDEITQLLRSVDPNIECVGIDAATLAHCRQPRYWWTNWYVQRLE